MILKKVEREYNVYIDESGDEGINKGSKYFILTAIIVDKEKDARGKPQPPFSQTRQNVA